VDGTSAGLKALLNGERSWLRWESREHEEEGRADLGGMMVVMAGQEKHDI
jgi:hypothetical protein